MTHYLVVGQLLMSLYTVSLSIIELTSKRTVHTEIFSKAQDKEIGFLKV